MCAGYRRRTIAGMKMLAGILFSLAVTVAIGVAAENSKPLFVQFIRGTDRECPNGTCREIGPKLSSRLSPVFRWKHFWEIDRKKLLVQPKKVTRVELSGDRRLEIQFTRANEVEVRLYRRSGLVTHQRHRLNNQMFILGGEDESHESFFVVVRQDEPQAGE